MQLPLVKTMIAVTFVAGLLPVIGNLLSNAVVVIASLSVSPHVAIGSLVYLVAIGFFSARNDADAHERGVKQVAIPSLGTRSTERRACRRSGGSAMRRSGAPAAKVASACSSAVTA